MAVELKDCISAAAIFASLALGIYNARRTSKIIVATRQFDDFKLMIREPLLAAVELIEQNNLQIDAEIWRKSQLPFSKRIVSARETCTASFVAARQLGVKLDAVHNTKIQTNAWEDLDSDFRDEQASWIDKIDLAKDGQELTDNLTQLRNCQRRVCGVVRRKLADEAPPIP